MKPGVIYRLNWAAFHETDDIQCYIDISDNDNLIDDGDTEEIRDLIPADPPATLSKINNDDNPFKVIRAKQLSIQFINTFNYGMADFASGSDNRWSVHYYIGDNTKTIFKGFLVKDDLREPLLPPTNVVTLTATDGIGLLKNIPLVNSLELNPRGKYKIIDLLSLCLSKTGLSLPIKVAFNIKLEGMNTDISSQNTTDEHLFSNAFLDALTFEEEVGLSENCYSVIEKILGHEAILFQYQGSWWVLRIDEVEDPTRGVYITSFDSGGSFIENMGEYTFVKTIGINDSIKFSQEASAVVFSGPKKSVRLDYLFETPAELPANVDFDRGDLIQTVSPTEKRYTVADWVTAREEATDEPNTSDIYVRRIFDIFGNVSDKALVIEAGPDYDFVLSEYIPVQVNDRFTLSLDRKVTGGTGGAREEGVKVRLYGDDGTFWTFESKSAVSNVSQWKQCTSSFRSNQGYFCFEPDNLDLTKAHGLYDGESLEIPVTGRLRIQLYKSPEYGDTYDTHYSNLIFTYIPYLAGSYRSYDGQYHRTEQSGNYKSRIKEEINVSDAPKKLFKGALLKLDSWAEIWNTSVDFSNSNFFTVTGFYTTLFYVGQVLRITGTSNNNFTTRVTGVEYGPFTGLTIVRVEATTVTEVESALIEEAMFSLANEFYNAAVFTAGPPDSTYVHTYGEIQMFDVWNQSRNEMRLIEATLQGCDLGQLDILDSPDIADVIHKWSCTDFSRHLYNKFFHLLHYQQDHNIQEWTGTFREVFDRDKPKNYENHEFRFINKGG